MFLLYCIEKSYRENDVIFLKLIKLILLVINLKFVVIIKMSNYEWILW